MNPYHAIEAIGIVISGLLFYSYTHSWFPPVHPRSRLRRALLNGVAFGGITVAMMIARIEVEPGIFIDARAVPVALIALFEGWPAGLVAALVGAAYRLWLGGSGAWPGVASLIGTAMVGRLCHAWAGRSGRVGPQHALCLAGLTFLVTMLGFSLLGARGLALWSQVWLDYLVTLGIGIGIVARLFYDVTEQHRLAATQARFRAMLDEATDAIRIVDADTGTILDANRTDCALSGYPREELIGRNVRDFWPRDPELRAGREAARAETLARGFSRAFADPYQTRSGEIVPVDSTRRMVEHLGRHYEIAIFRRAGERLAAETVQREAAELRAASLLARAASHEINNPLAVIMGYLQIMAERPGEGAKDVKGVTRMLDAATRIRDSVERLKGIIRIEPTEAGGGVPPILDTRKSSAPEPGPAPTSAPTPSVPPPGSTGQ